MKVKSMKLIHKNISCLQNEKAAARNIKCNQQRQQLMAIIRIYGREGYGAVALPGWR